MTKYYATFLGLAALLIMHSGDVRAGELRLSADQMDQVTAAGGQITSIGPAKTKSAVATAKLPKRGGKLRGGQIASI